MDLNSSVKVTKDMKCSPNIKLKKQKLDTWFACDVIDCNYRSVKKSNLIRHIKETHNGQKSTCVCGKWYTASALSRHKHECPALLQQKSTELKNAVDDKCNSANYNIAGIDGSEISNIKEHTMVIKVVTKTDGSIVFVYENFVFNNTTYALMPLNVNEIQLTSDEITSSCDSGKKLMKCIQ